MPLTTAICAARSLVEVNIGGRARPERNEERGTRNEERGSSRPGATGLLARRPQILAHVVLPRARPSASAVASCRSAHPTQHRTVNPTPGRTLDSWYVGPVTLAWYVGTVFRPERQPESAHEKQTLAGCCGRVPKPPVGSPMAHALGPSPGKLLCTETVSVLGWCRNNKHFQWTRPRERTRRPRSPPKGGTGAPTGTW